MVNRLARLIFPLHLVCIAATLAQPTSPAVFLGRFSRTSLILFVLLVLTAPLAWLVPRVLRRFRLPLVAGAGLFIGCSAAIFGLWLLIDNPTPSYIILRLYISFALAVAALWALESVPLAIDAVGVVFVVTLISIGVEIGAMALSTRFPGLLWTDEGYNTSLALSFAWRGVLGVPSFQYASSGPMYSLIYIGLGAWYSVFGVSLASGRFFVLLAGMAGLQFLFFASRRVYGRYAATAAVVVGLSALIAMNYLRADVGVGLFLAIAFYYFTLAEYGRDGTPRQGQILFHLVAGIAVGFSLDGHPSAYRFVIAFGLAYLLEYVVLVRERRRIVMPWAQLLFGVGAAFGLGAYILLYSALAPETFLSNLQNPNIMGEFSLPRAFDLLIAQFNALLANMPVLLGCGLLGMIVALRGRGPMNRLLVIVLVSNVLIFALTYTYHRDYYTLHNLAALALLGAAGFSALQAEQERAEHQLIGVALLVTTAALGVVSGQVRADESQDYGQALVVAEEIRHIVPTDERVVGIDPFVLRMYDYPEFIDMNAAAVIAARDRINEAVAWEQIDPSAVVIVRDYPIRPPEALLAYTTNHAFRLVRCWETSRLGRVELLMRRLPPDIEPDSHCTPLTVEEIPPEGDLFR